jgi:hypothetical protein
MLDTDNWRFTETAKASPAPSAAYAVVERLDPDVLFAMLSEWKEESMSRNQSHTGITERVSAQPLFSVRLKFTRTTFRIVGKHEVIRSYVEPNR